jgi:hypothetical protein
MSKALDLLLTPNLTLSVSGRRNGGPAYEEHSADQLGLWIDRLRPDTVMSGMTLGVDMLGAELALDRDRALHAVIPGEWQTNRWNQDERAQWRALLSQARRLKVIDTGDLPGGQRSQSYALGMYQQRNHWIATHSTLTLVCWDGVPSGGTYSMLRICREVNQPVLLVEPGHPTRLLCDAKALARAISRPVTYETEATEATEAAVA